MSVVSGERLGRPTTNSPETIGRIVAERAAGRTWQAIADQLNADAIPTAHGGLKWYPSTALHIYNAAQNA